MYYTFLEGKKPTFKLFYSLQACALDGYLMIFFFIDLFIYFLLHWVFVAAQAFSRCEWGLLFTAVCRVLIADRGLSAWAQ